MSSAFPDRRFKNVFVLAVIIAGVELALSGCASLLGESFTAQDMRNPNTGDTKLCIAHNMGRGEASKAEIDTMNACVNWYLSQGFQRQ